MDKRLPLIELQIDEANESFVSAISLVSAPAIESDWLVFNSQEKEKFAINDDKQVITGAAMIPDKPIFRTSPGGNYYAVFSKDTIQKIQQVFFKKGLIQSLNVEHDSESPASDSYIFSSYITDKALGVSAPTALGDLSDGSWIISVKIDNPALWKKVKNGDVSGYSVEGVFSLLPTEILTDGKSDVDDLELSKAIREFNAALERVNKNNG